MLRPVAACLARTSQGPAGCPLARSDHCSSSIATQHTRHSHKHARVVRLSYRSCLAAARSQPIISTARVARGVVGDEAKNCLCKRQRRRKRTDRRRNQRSEPGRTAVTVAQSCSGRLCAFARCSFTLAVSIALTAAWPSCCLDALDAH